ncbi:MAG TPA: RluA family pseudouridine synthase [Alphaproteobacteria bacterium]|nr:RluA family pseudouridine synthase [Alphaproteobacteria bacterium]
MAMTKALSARMNPVQSLGLAAQAWIAAMAGEVKYQVTAGTEDAGRRVDSVLARAVPALSRSRIKRLIEEGHVRAGATAVTDPASKVRLGQTFAILVPETQEARPQAQAIPLIIIYEDEQLVVIDKPAGLVVHPAPGNADRTLVNALIAHCGTSLSGIGGIRRPGIVHRLDKDTSGLMVVAKTDVAHAGLMAQFTQRQVERAYRAIVWGVPRPRDGVIEGNIGRDPYHRQRMAVVGRGGKAALTRYRVIEEYGTVASLLECRLATGRTHQIRVHLAARGNPLMGDPVYGRAKAARRSALPAEAQEALAALGRQALDAYRLGFTHPTTGERLHFEKDFPRDINRLKNSLERL